MPLNPTEVDLLWRRLEDAKLQLDHCHNYVREIQQDHIAGTVSDADGNVAYRHALVMEEQAVSRYWRALNDFKAVLALGPATGAAERDTEKTNEQ